MEIISDSQKTYFDKDEKEAVKAVIDKFVEYDEYILIEFDTVKGTATVVGL